MISGLVRQKERKSLESCLLKVFNIYTLFTRNSNKNVFYLHLDLHIFLTIP